MQLKNIFLSPVVFVLIVSSLVLGAAGAEITAQEKAQVRETAEIINNYEQWKGLGFGLGYGMSFPRRRIIEGHEIVNDTFKVTHERSAVQSVMLESHFFIPLAQPSETSHRQTLKRLDQFRQNNDFPQSATDNYKRAEEAYEEIRGLRGVGIGPFVCLIPGTDNFLKALGFGLMVGFRRGTTSNSFNVGLGYVNYSDMPTLAEGVTDNGALPENYGNPIKTGNVGGLLILFSFSF